MRPGTEACKLVVVEHTFWRDPGGDDDGSTKRTAQVSLLRKTSRFWDTFQSGWHMARQLGRTSAESPKGVEQRRPILQEHRRTVEIKCKQMVDKVYSVFIFGV